MRLHFGAICGLVLAQPMNPFDYPLGTILGGDPADIDVGRRRFAAQAIDDMRLNDGPYPYPMRRTTLAASASATGVGTYDRRFQRTVEFVPGAKPGWWIDRTDLPGQFPTEMSIRNVRSAAMNITLRTGADANRLRMVEHIVALKLGLGVDNAVLRVRSDDPPLFDRSSLPLVEAFRDAGIRELDEPASFVTVAEPVTFGSGRQDFLTFLPAKPGEYGIRLDVAVDFASAIGKQRIVYDVTPETFGFGAAARTNAPYSLYLYTRTLGRILNSKRKYGYTTENILIHKRRSYLNPPLFEREAVWHRATLDLLAALALVDGGRFCGTVVSYRAGHRQDCAALAAIELAGLLVPHR